MCSSFGQAADSFVEVAKTMAQSDPNLLVRTRAAEFLGLTQAADPRPPIMAALAASQSPVEANLILNTVVLLRDGNPNYEFKITPQSFDPSVRSGAYVRRRLEYLDPAGAQSDQTTQRKKTRRAKRKQ